eukprot:951353_1
MMYIQTLWLFYLRGHSFNKLSFKVNLVRFNWIKYHPKLDHNQVIVKVNKQSHNCIVNSFIYVVVDCMNVSDWYLLILFSSVLAFVSFSFALALLIWFAFVVQLHYSYFVHCLNSVHFYMLRLVMLLDDPNQFQGRRKEPHCREHGSTK